MEPASDRRLLNSFAPGSDEDHLIRGILTHFSQAGDTATAKVAREALAGERPVTELGETSWMQKRLRAATDDPEFTKRLQESHRPKTPDDSDGGPK